MKAYVCRKFGAPEVLELAELPKPVPKDREVLVRVRATTVSAADWRVRSRILPKGFGLLAGAFLGFTRPRQPILGTELAGEVEAVGKSVSAFAVGDPCSPSRASPSAATPSTAASPRTGPWRRSRRT
jgi:NADPH:quinone reductase-like Zn-dependent oxidoreductase